MKPTLRGPWTTDRILDTVALGAVLLWFGCGTWLVLR